MRFLLLPHQPEDNIFKIYLLVFLYSLLPCLSLWFLKLIDSLRCHSSENTVIKNIQMKKKADFFPMNVNIETQYYTLHLWVVRQWSCGLAKTMAFELLFIIWSENFFDHTTYQLLTSPHDKAQVPPNNMPGPLWVGFSVPFYLQLSLLHEVLVIL